MGFFVYLVLAFLVGSKAQYFDPVLFQQDGKGEVSDVSQVPLNDEKPTDEVADNKAAKIASEKFNDEEVKDDPKDTASKISSKVSNAASKATEDESTQNRDIKRRPGVVVERWDGLDGYDIKNMVLSSRFPTLPNLVIYWPTFSEPDNWADSYGSRIRGYFHAPQTGNYVFRISSDAQGQLYISTDKNMRKKVMIAEISLDHYSDKNQYDKYREQRSQNVFLDEGHYYYIEALHKDQFLDDHLEVEVTLPDNVTYAPIPEKFLWTLPPPEEKAKEDPMGLIKVAAKAGAEAGATLGVKEAAEKGAQAGALAGERAGVQAGAAAGAIAARKAATAVAMKTLSEALRNISLQSHMLNVFTSKGGASASAFSNVKVNAGAGTSAGAQTSTTGGAKGSAQGGAKVGGPGSKTTQTESKTTQNFPVVEPQAGENVQSLAKTFANENGAASKVVIGSYYIIHSMNIPATHDFHKNLCWRGLFGRIVLGRRCQVFKAVKGFLSHKDGQQTVSWESACAPGYFIIQKNYNFKLAKLDNTDKFRMSATFVAFRTLKFPEAFMFELMHKGWFMCESMDANFHITNIVARYNEPTITWIQRCSFVIRVIAADENPMMNCFFVLPVVPQKSKPTPKRNITTLPPQNLTTPAPTIAPTEVVHFEICLRIEFINDAGFPYRLFSSLKPGGYFVYGRVFVVKYVLPKKSKAVTPTPKKPTDASTKYLGQRDRIAKALQRHLSRKETVHYQIKGRHRYSRALNEDDKLDVKSEVGRNIKMRRHLKGRDKKKNKKDTGSKSNVSSSKRKMKSEDKKYDWKKSRETQIIGSKKSVIQTDGSNASAKDELDEISSRKTVNENNAQKRSEVKPSEKSAEEVLNEISPASEASAKPQAAMIERFPRPRNTIANAFTHIIFSAEDPLKRYELLIDGKKNITLIVSQDCENPVDLKLAITKRPFTTPPPATVKTTPATTPTTPKTTPAPPPPLPFPPPPPPPLPPPPPPIPPPTTPTTRPTTPSTTPPPTTTPSTTPKPTPPPTTAGPPPLPPTAVPAPAPPLPPPPPPLPPPPPATPPPPPTVIIVPPVEGCMPTHEGTSEGACCVFPFVYQGVKQHGCIRAERKYRWCATTGNYDKDKQWGFCPHCYLAHGGTGAGECCHFPFVYNGKMYMQCLKDSNGKPWCATTFSFDHDKKFGYCGDPEKTPSPEKCPPSCAVKCQPSCPIQCCSGSKQAEQNCPATCEILCTPDCPAKCCAVPKGSSICPPQCAKECQPDCPAKCCTGVLKLGNTKPGTHECPKECLKSCKPYCPEKCCLGELVPIVIEKDECPKKCLRSCLPECSSQCCRGLLIEDKTIITGLPCPQQCSPTQCTPDCPAKCCAGATPITDTKTNECPPECSSQPCKPDCPAKCCMAVLSPVTAAPTCSAQCTQTCTPTCPAECCAPQTTPAPVGCNQECLILCKPDCPAKCCTAKCPPECAKSCGPNCPVVCCPEGTIPAVQNCPKECSASTCKPDCPAKCCTTVLTPLEPGSTCPTICYQTCQPDCPAKCCKSATAVDTKPETCPAECAGKCQPGCPPKCCVIVLTPMKQGKDNCPSSCSQACLPVCPAKCCEAKPEKETSSSVSNPEPCPPSCSWACLPTCPVRCCPKSFPGEDTTPGSTKATCPSPCLVSCKPSCPFKCCLEAFANPTARASIADPSLGSCPTSCYTKCTPSCPVKCCSIVVTYDKKNSIKNAKKVS